MNQHPIVLIDPVFKWRNTHLFQVTALLLALASLPWGQIFHDFRMLVIKSLPPGAGQRY